MSANLGALSASPQARAALANPRDHLYGIRMPRAKFRANPLKIVAVYKEQRTHTDSILYM